MIRVGIKNEEHILDTLREAGYRLTAPRRKLVDLLLRAEAPLTAEEIYQRARRANVRANLSTIYRNLATFTELGWLDALPGPTGERHYQVHATHEQRMSVMCLDCGQLTTLQADRANPLNALVRDLGFDSQSLRVTMSAHCDHVCSRRPDDGRLANQN
jgi:Fe2+ or Zn2+ uptake regulation protein